MIFVTVGTHEQPFNRLVEKIDELKGRVKGEKTRKVYQIGDKVIVRVIKTNLEKRAVEFRLLRKDK